MALVAYTMRRGGSRERQHPSKGFKLAEQREQEDGKETKGGKGRKRKQKEAKGGKRKQKELKGAFPANEFRILYLLLSGCSMLDPHAQACVLAGVCCLESAAGVSRSLAR